MAETPTTPKRELVYQSNGTTIIGFPPVTLNEAQVEYFLAAAGLTEEYVLSTGLYKWREVGSSPSPFAPPAVQEVPPVPVVETPVDQPGIPVLDAGPTKPPLIVPQTTWRTPSVSPVARPESQPLSEETTPPTTPTATKE